jgi:glycosyltransferase involved in cell wall biosynthesis
MKIGFIISGIGVYGSVREVVENSNQFINLGHEVIIFNPEGNKIWWLDCKAECKLLNEISNYEFDLLILVATPNFEYYEILKNAKAAKKVFCFMGFDTKFNPFDNKNLKQIAYEFIITADGQWQLDWLTENTKCRVINAPLGGINTEMFKPLQKERKEIIIGWSGDGRKRKGGIFIQEMLIKYNLKAETYFNKNIPQNRMAEWFAGIDIFIDNHYSGGWCNPVAEAMACKKAIVCSYTLCNSMFAKNEETAMMFEYGKVDDMYTQLMKYFYNQDLIKSISENGYNKIKEFDYKIISSNFLQAIKEI